MPEPLGHSLLTETLGVVNQALDAHRDEPAWRDLLRRARERLGGLDLGVAIHEGEASTPVDYYTVRLHEDKFEVTSRGKTPVAIDWRVSVEKLRWIAENAQTCIDTPDELGLEWLKRRVA